MRSFFSTAGWIGGYLGLVLAPLIVLLTGPRPPGSGFWWDFSMALGFTGMAMMGVQFLLTARFPFANAAFGIDIIYFFHRYLAVIALTLLVLHVLIIGVRHPAALESLNPLRAPWHMTAAIIALAFFALLILTALGRKTLKIRYEAWRLLHIGLAGAAFLLALYHVGGVGHYINTPVKRGLWTGYALFWVLLILYIRLIKPWQMQRRPYRVTAVRPERGSSWTLALQPEGHAGMTFQPGQFAWLTLRASPWHIKEHPFSFSSSAARPEQLEFTIKELGDFTRTIKDIPIGETAYLDGPYGAFSTDRYPAAPGFVFIAGGVGIAPVMSMLRTLADRRDPRPVRLIYANHRWEDVIFREELEDLQKRLALRLTHVLEAPPTDWRGETGVITRSLLGRLLPDAAEKQVYFLCGPTSMSNLAQQELRALRVPPGQVHFELFDMV